MLSCCLKRRKNTESKNPEVLKTMNWRIILLSNCEVYGSKKSRFIKEHKASQSLVATGKVRFL